MAHFYGTVDGRARTIATRTWTRKSGLRTIAASWEGAVNVCLSDQDGTTHVVIELIPWEGCGTRRVLYVGPINK